MKKTFFTIATFLLLAVFFVSCESEEIQNDSPQNLDTTSLELGNESLSPNSFMPSDPATLENYSQWASFVTSYLLRHSADAQNLFVSNMSTGKTVDFDVAFAIPDNPSDYNFPNDFKKTLLRYLDGSWSPDTQTTKPPTPGTPPFAGGGEVDPEVLTQQIMDYLLQDNCMEFYFPNSLSFVRAPFTITSTAHPLTTADSNDGIIRLYTHIPDPNNGNLPSSTFPQLVNDEYAALGRMIIVTRPVRESTPGSPCLYDEYPGLDFRLFLD